MQSEDRGKTGGRFICLFNLARGDPCKYYIMLISFIKRKISSMAKNAQCYKKISQVTGVGKQSLKKQTDKTNKTSPRLVSCRTNEPELLTLFYVLSYYNWLL